MSRLLGTALWLGLLVFCCTAALLFAADRTGRPGPSSWGQARQDVAESWGGPIAVSPPGFLLVHEWTELETDPVLEKRVEVVRTATERLLPSDIVLASRLDLSDERRGFLDFEAFELTARDRFEVTNSTGFEGPLQVVLQQPPGATILYDYTLTVHQGGQATVVRPDIGRPTQVVEALAPGEAVTVELRYATKGMGAWRYNLSEWQGTVLPSLAATVQTDSPHFRLLRRGIPHTRSTDAGGTTLDFALSDFATTQDLGLHFSAREHVLAQVGAVLRLSPLALALLLAVALVWGQALDRPVGLVSYALLAVLHAGFFLVAAYGARFVPAPGAFAVSLVVCLGLFLLTMPAALGRDLALRVGLPALVVLTAGFSAALWLPQARGLALLGLGLGAFVAVSWPLTRSDPSTWPLVRPAA